MPLKYQKRLLAHLSHDTYKPTDAAALGRDLQIEDQTEFEKALADMAEQGLIDINPAGQVRLPSVGSMGGEMVGSFRSHPKGFGFVQPDATIRERSVFIPPDETMDAMTGDRVCITVRKDRKRTGGTDGPSFSGAVVEIIERARSSFVGEIERRGAQWLALPDGKVLTKPIVLRDAESKNVKPGDKVVFELVEYPSSGRYGVLGEGVITKVLGEAGEPDAETQGVIAAYSLPPNEFPKACNDQAREINKQFEENVERFERDGPKTQPDRLDLTDEFIITIDPPDAKDYDDAISIKSVDNGWEVSVHIADVGEFIEQNTPLDREALNRGNSCYLPRLVIPMLPELLSNGICSLQEGVTRFTKTAIMRYDRKGRITAEGVASTIIRSAKRLTYLEAQALIDGNAEEAKKHAKTDTPYTDQLITTLKQMNACAKAIQGRRQDQGMISLDLPDAELIFDEDGHVIDAVPEDDAFTHTLIEMFMVESNEVLARLFEDIDVPLIRRIHPAPTPGDVDEMRQSAKVAGYTIPKSPTREELQGLLNATRGTPAARAVHMAVLRTLTKAEYSPGLIGHFALASSAYAHFTSPIRRYADLTVHRALLAYLRETDNGRLRPTTQKERRALSRKLLESPLCPHQEDLVTVARQCTNKEQNAESAERELRQYLILQFLEGKVGESMPGVITGVTPRGVFVQLDKYLADGMVKVEDLPGDVTRDGRRPRWQIDKKSGAIVDVNSGRSFNIGDMVTVTIANIDLARRQMDLVITNAASRAGGKAKLKLASDLGGGLGGGGGPGFTDRPKMTGGQRRSRKSKSRDKGKTDYRRDKKKK
jgi:ribonuclease R